MELINKNIGFAITGSFCTIAEALPQMEALVKSGAKVTPILSEAAYSTDTRFGTASELLLRIEEITGTDVIHTIKAAEPIGPQKLLDALVVAPCTGNTLSKMANGINDTTVTMAANAV